MVGACFVFLCNVSAINSASYAGSSGCTPTDYKCHTNGTHSWLFPTNVSERGIMVQTPSSMPLLNKSMAILLNTNGEWAAALKEMKKDRNTNTAELPSGVCIPLVRLFSTQNYHLIGVENSRHLSLRPQLALIARGLGGKISPKIPQFGVVRTPRNCIYRIVEILGTVPLSPMLPAGPPPHQSFEIYRVLPTLPEYTKLERAYPLNWESLFSTNSVGLATYVMQKNYNASHVDKLVYVYNSNKNLKIIKINSYSTESTLQSANTPTNTRWTLTWFRVLNNSSSPLFIHRAPINDECMPDCKEKTMTYLVSSWDRYSATQTQYSSQLYRVGSESRLSRFG